MKVEQFVNQINYYLVWHFVHNTPRYVWNNAKVGVKHQSIRYSSTTTIHAVAQFAWKYQDKMFYQHKLFHTSYKTGLYYFIMKIHKSFDRKNIWKTNPYFGFTMSFCFRLQELAANLYYIQTCTFLYIFVCHFNSFMFDWIITITVRTLN